MFTCPRGLDDRLEMCGFDGTHTDCINVIASEESFQGWLRGAVELFGKFVRSRAPAISVQATSAVRG